MFPAESFQLRAKEDIGEREGGWDGWMEGFSWRSTGFNGSTRCVSEFACPLEFNMQQRAVAPRQREHFSTAGRKQHIFMPKLLKCLVFY